MLTALALFFKMGLEGLAPNPTSETLPLSTRSSSVRNRFVLPSYVLGFSGPQRPGVWGHR